MALDNDVIADFGQTHPSTASPLFTGWHRIWNWLDWTMWSSRAKYCGPWSSAAALPDWAGIRKSTRARWPSVQCVGCLHTNCKPIISSAPIIFAQWQNVQVFCFSQSSALYNMLIKDLCIVQHVHKKTVPALLNMFRKQTNTMVWVTTQIWLADRYVWLKLNWTRFIHFILQTTQGMCVWVELCGHSKGSPPRHWSSSSVWVGTKESWHFRWDEVRHNQF